MLVKYFIFAFALFSATMGSFSCDDNNDAGAFDPNEKGELTLEFDNVVGSANLQLNGPQSYTNAAGETFNITLFNYFISNIKLKKADGTEYVLPQDSSYFLVKESDRTSQLIKLKNIPAGDYTAVTFTVGVDSMRNTMDLSKRGGILDPAANTGENNMYWSWNSGYIFVKMEGISDKAPADAAGNRKFRYHVGGYGGLNSKTINNVKTVTRAFPAAKAVVRAKTDPLVHITVDVLKFFSGSATVSIATNPTVHFAPFSVNLANNYTEMFQVHHIHND